MKKILGALLVVVTIYLVTVLILWLLTFIGPIDAVVEGVIDKGGNIWFAAGGALGAFLLIAALGLFAVYMLLRALAKAAPELTSAASQAVSKVGRLLMHM